jgi:hypothetical protein
MEIEKEVACILGIVSIVVAFFQPLGAIVISIIGLVQNMKDKSKVAKRLNIIGLILGIIVLIMQIIMIYFVASQGLNTTFPTY